MEAETCSICSANVRCAGVGLKSYLSSGKSSAMAISLRPISFHCESTTCEGLGASRGASLAVRANRNEAPKAIAKTSVAPKTTFFIVSLLDVRCVTSSADNSHRQAQVRTRVQTGPLDVSLVQTAFFRKRFLGLSGC